MEQAGCYIAIQHVAGARGGTLGACGGALGAGTAGTHRGRKGHGRGLGVPVCRLGMLAGSVGLVCVFGAPDSL